MSASTMTVPFKAHELNEQLHALKMELKGVETLPGNRVQHFQAKSEQAVLILVQSGEAWLSTTDQFQNRALLKKFDFVILRDSAKTYSLQPFLPNAQNESEVTETLSLQGRNHSTQITQFVVGRFQFDLFQLPLVNRLFPRYLHRNLADMGWNECYKFHCDILAILAKQMELLFLQSATIQTASIVEVKPQPEVVSEPIPQDPRFVLVAQKLAAQLDHPWTVESMARLIFVSRSTFAQRFHEQLGVPPLEYLYKLRMEHAQKLLKESHIEIAAIGKMVGYDSPSSFSSAFKRFYGHSPIIFRRDTDERK